MKHISYLTLVITMMAGGMALASSKDSKHADCDKGAHESRKVASSDEEQPTAKEIALIENLRAQREKQIARLKNVK